MILHCVTLQLRTIVFTKTSRLYYEGVVLLQHYVSTTKGLFYYNITFLLRRGCFTSTSRFYTKGLFYYNITCLLRMGCFTTTSRHYYEGVVLLQHHDITFLLRIICLLIHVLLQLHLRYISTITIIFCAMFWLLLVLGISSKFRKPLGIKKGVRLYFVFLEFIGHDWLICFEKRTDVDYED